MRVNDIMTLITAAFVFIRITVASWVGIAAGRCALVLLETRSLDLRDFRFIVSWHLPPLPHILSLGPPVDDLLLILGFHF
jgi:hypothetical protein